MAKMEAATIWVDGPWIKLRSPYNRNRTPAFNQELKDHIHYSFRKWNPEEKVWMVDVSQEAKLLRILERHFENVTYIEENVAEPQLLQPPSSDHWGELLRMCPDKALPKVWRTIAAALHPDGGGDTEKFKVAGQLWEQVRAERGL